VNINNVLTIMISVKRIFGALSLYFWNKLLFIAFYE